MHSQLYKLLLEQDNTASNDDVVLSVLCGDMNMDSVEQAQTSHALFNVFKDPCQVGGVEQDW